PGRCQRLRSPNSPPVLSGPRTGSAIDSPPALPWIFQVAVTAAPAVLVIVAQIRPRPSFWASLTPPSSLWEALRPLTEIACPAAVRCAVGTVKLTVPVVAGVVVPVASTFWPRYTPSTQACSSPAPPPP